MNGTERLGFRITASSSIHVLARMLDYFARAGLDVDRVVARANGSEMHVAIDASSLDSRMAAIIVERMRGDIGVASAAVAPL